MDWNTELDLLYEYLCGWIDGPRGLKISMELLEGRRVDEIIDLWKTTGVILWSDEDHHQPEITPLTFDEWKNLRKNRNDVKRIFESLSPREFKPKLWSK